MNALDVARPPIGTRDKTLKCARRRRASRADVEEPSGKSRRPPPRVTISSNPGERSGGFQRGAVCRSRRRRRKVQVAQSCSFNLPAAGLPCYQTRACVGFFSTTTPGPTSLVKSPLTSAACLLTRRVQEYKSNVNLPPPPLIFRGMQKSPVQQINSLLLILPLLLLLLLTVKLGKAAGYCQRGLWGFALLRFFSFSFFFTPSCLLP